MTSLPSSFFQLKCSVVLVNQLSEQKKTSCFVALASFHGVDIPTMANFKLQNVLTTAVQIPEYLMMEMVRSNYIPPLRNFTFSGEAVPHLPRFIKGSCLHSCFCHQTRNHWRVGTVITTTTSTTIIIMMSSFVC